MLFLRDGARADAATEADEAGGELERWLMLLPSASASRLADVSTPDAAVTRPRNYSGESCTCGTRSETASFNVERRAECVRCLA